MMVLAVTLHNIPEGMAVGVVYAGLRSGSANITAGGALALALGIAIQNFPEGAIISMPLYAEGKSKPKAFWLGVISGAVEPLFGGLTVIVAGLVVPAIDQNTAMGRWAFLPAFVGFWLGIGFLLLLDHVIPHLHRRIDQAEGPKIHLSRTIMMVLAVTLHNIPEGMAVGVVYAGLRTGLPTSRQAGPWPSLWASPSRTFRRGPSSPCPSTRRARASPRPSGWASSPGRWSPSSAGSP